MGGCPCGRVVKDLRILLQWPGFMGSDLGTDLFHLSSMSWRHPTYKIEEDWHRCQLRANLPQAKDEDDWQQMLTQGDYSSHTHTHTQNSVMILDSLLIFLCIIQ